MAGQRMYYSNVQTNTRGSVRFTAQIYVSTNAATPSVVAGRGVSTVFGLGALAAGPTSTLTVYWPERFAATKVTWLGSDYQSATTSQNAVYSLATVVWTTPTTPSSPSYSVFQFFTPTASGAAVALTPAVGTFFVEVEGELGM